MCEMKFSEWLKETAAPHVCPELVSITGGGGKTSLLYMLGRVFSKEKTVLLTSTTKIYRPEPEQCRSLFTGPALYACRFAQAMERPALLTAAAREENGKMTGYACSDLEEAAAAFPEMLIAAECDGSRGLSAKYYESWEPPVPACTGLLFAVAGADAICAPADESHIFRAEKFCSLHGVRYGTALAMPDFIRYIISNDGPLRNCPASAKKIAVINKWDAAAEDARGEAEALLAGALDRYDAVVCASLKEDRIYKVLER